MMSRLGTSLSEVCVIDLLTVLYQLEAGMRSFHALAQSATSKTWQAARWRKPPDFSTVYAAVRFSLSTVRNSFWRRSTATKYATSLRATARVARFAFPFCLSRSYTSASPELRRGASLAASISTLCRCLLRCLERGVRLIMFAELFSAPHSPQHLIAFFIAEKRS